MIDLISVVFCLKPKARGQSALFDAIQYISGPYSAYNNVTVGWTGEIAGNPKLSADDINRIEQQQFSNEGLRQKAVWLYSPQENKEGRTHFQNQRRWRQYGEQVLHPLFHYQQEESNVGSIERDLWNDYCSMNEIFAEEIVELYKPGTLIWIHDYQLMLLPALLRERLPDALIGFFLHIPFPSVELMRNLEHRDDILKGLLGATLIGFQSASYCRHFESCYQRFHTPERLQDRLEAIQLLSTTSDTAVSGRRISFHEFPIGIDSARIESYALEDLEVLEKLRSIKILFGDKKLIVGRDRLDTTRGIVQKLRAFELFLLRYPKWQGKVILVQVTSSSISEDEYSTSINREASKIHELVTRINGTYGSLEFSPIHHYTQQISRKEYFALLRAADVALITSLRDGMSTTSLEFIVSQKDGHGPLILSEFSGTADSLKGARVINPWNLEDVARAIDEALTMPNLARELQSERLYKQVSTHTAQAWANDFLRYLTRMMPNGTKKEPCTPVLNYDRVYDCFHVSRTSLFLFDYDGTLTPIVGDPKAAVPSEELLTALTEMSALDRKISFWIISGRDRDFLDTHLGRIPNIGLSAEHGCFIKYPGQASWEKTLERTDMAWYGKVMEIFKDFTRRVEGSHIEQKALTVTWHYRGADPIIGGNQAYHCQLQIRDTIMTQYDVEVIEGKANVEVRPAGINKGLIVRRLLSEFEAERKVAGAIESPYTVICAGDDHTDEDMFRELINKPLNEGTVFTCVVGLASKPTIARWRLPEPVDVVSLITNLCRRASSFGKV